MSKTRARELLMRALSLLLLVYTAWINGVAASSSLAVDATVLAGTCDVLINTNGASQTAPGAATANLILPQVMSYELSKGLMPANLTPVTVQVSNCGGTRGSKGSLPSLTVTGDTVTVSGVQEAHLFREGTSTADARIGVVLATSDQPNPPGSPWEGYLAANSRVTLSQTPVNYNGISVQGKKDFWLGTSCGTAVQCSGAPSRPLAGGDVTAALTFEFSYQ